MANPINEYNYAEFLVLNDHAQNVKDAQVLVAPAANKVSAAQADLDAAQAAYDAAHAKHVASVDDAAEAKRIYESFLGHTEDPGTEPDNPNVEVWDPDNTSGTTAGKGAGNKSASNKAHDSAAQSGDQGNGAEVESSDEAQAEESTGLNASNVRTVPSKVLTQQQGVSPFLIAGIVGVCLLIAAGLLAFMLVRRRHAGAAAGAAASVATGSGAAGAVTSTAAEATTTAAAADASASANDPSSVDKAN